MKKNNSVIGIQTLFLLLISLCKHVPVTSIILIKNKRCQQTSNMMITLVLHKINIRI